MFLTLLQSIVVPEVVTSSTGWHPDYDKKKRYIIGNDVLFLNSSELANVLIQKAQEIPETSIIKNNKLQSIQKESILQTKRIAQYFPSYSNLIAELDNNNAQLLRELVEVEIQKRDDEEMILIAMLH